MLIFVGSTKGLIIIRDHASLGYMSLSMQVCVRGYDEVVKCGCDDGPLMAG